MAPKAATAGKPQGKPQPKAAAKANAKAQDSGDSDGSDLSDDDEVLSFAPVVAGTGAAARKPAVAAAAAKPNAKAKAKAAAAAAAAAAASGAKAGAKRKAAAQQRGRGNAGAGDDDDDDDGGDSDELDADDDADGGAGSDDDWVEAEFEFYDAQPSDWWAIKELLKAYIDESALNKSALKKPRAAAAAASADADAAAAAASAAPLPKTIIATGTKTGVKRAPPGMVLRDGPGGAAGVAAAPAATGASSGATAAAAAGGAAAFEEFDSQGLAQLIAGQVSVGTMVKSGGRDEQPLAFITALHWNTYRNERCLQQLQTYLLETAPTPAIRATLSAYLQPAASGSSNGARPAAAAAGAGADAGAGVQSLGLLIHERVINTPSELLPHFHTALADDIAWAAKNDENKAAYQFSHFVLVTRCMVESGRVRGGAAVKPKANSAKKLKASSGTVDMQSILRDAMFPKFEDQFYAQESELIYFPRDGGAADAKARSIHGADTQRVVMLFPAAAVPRVAKRLADALGAETVDAAPAPAASTAAAGRGGGGKRGGADQ